MKPSKAPPTFLVRKTGEQLGKKTPYLHEHPKNGGFYFRRGIPADLQQFFPDRNDYWRQNFGHKDRARAEVETRELSNIVDAAFIDAAKQLERMRAAAQPVSVPSGVVVRLVSVWTERERFRRAQLVMNGAASGRPEFDNQVKVRKPFGRQSKAEEPEEWLSRLKVEDSYLQGWIQSLLNESGIALHPDHPARVILWNQLRDAWKDVLLEEHQWRIFEGLASMPIEAPAEIPLAKVAGLYTPSGHSLPPAAPAGLLLTEALERWSNPSKAVRTKAPARRTIIEAKLAVRRYVEFAGDVPINSIKRSDARAFRDAYELIPKHLTKEINRLPIKEILKLDLADFDLRSAVTINKSLNLLSAILSAAESEGYLDDDRSWSSPFAVLLKVDHRLEKSYNPFSLTQLESLSRSPVFAHGERPKGGRGETAKWAPLIALFHGPRRSEILQLVVGDISQDADTGIWVMSFQADEEAKALKNAGSRRTIPIHPALIEWGFLGFVSKRRAAVGVSGSLWEGFEDRRKMYGKMVRWSKWFHGYLSEHVVDDRQLKFHSFRGTFKRYGRDTVSPKVLDAICGHSSGKVGDEYGKLDGDTGFNLPFLYQELSKVSFESFPASQT